MRIRRLFPVMAILIVLIVGGRAVSRGQVGVGDPNVRLLAEAIARVQGQYVEEMSIDELTHRAIRGMLMGLDPYSVYLDADDFTNLRINTRGNYEGLGIKISISDGFLTVIAPFEGTPAHREGIMTGDKIIEIDGESTESMTLGDAVDRMRGSKGTAVQLKIARGRRGRILDFEVTRDVIELKSVPFVFADPNGIGYVRLAAFSEHTGADLRQSIDGLREQGIRGLILDMRGNPGGLLEQAVEVAECFVPAGRIIVETRGRHDQDERQYTSRSERVYGDLPLVVMIDPGSASASEIVAGAVQDWDLGLVVGKTSFGKASVQTVLGLSDGSAIKLTTAKYYTPSGRSIQREDRREDPRVTAAIDPDGKERHIARGDTFYTSIGREISGGGGIAPDVELEPTEYPDVVQDTERHRLFQEFAADMIERGVARSNLAAVAPQELERFRGLLDREEDLELAESDFEEHLAFFERGIRREIKRSLEGDLAALQLLLEGDEQYLEARRLFDEAPTLRDMFNLADGRRETDAHR